MHGIVGMLEQIRGSLARQQVLWCSHVRIPAKVINQT
jgi:hypothetical protein